MRKAAIYARFSTELQSPRSIDDQIALCSKFAQANGFQVVGTYNDKAKSGSSMLERDGLLRLLNDAKNGQFDAVIVEALDRVSRDQEDMAAIYKRLKFLGIDIIAVHDGKADTIQIGIRGLIGAIYLEDLKHKVRRGMSGRVRDGLSAGGKAYGYKPVLGKPGELVIDEEEAVVVRRVFREYADGKNPREIALGLNRDGFKPPRGLVWNPSTLIGSKKRTNGILRNPLYGGVLIWNRVTMVRDPETGKRVSRNNPESEWQRKNVPELRIVDEETAAMVAARVEERTFETTIERSPKRPRMLSGLLKCGKCGGGMTLDGYNNGKPRIRCVRTRETGTCDHTRKYQVEAIEFSVVEAMREQLSDPDLLKAYIDSYIQERRRLATEINRNRATIERNLSKAQGELDRMLTLCIKGLMTDEEFGERRGALDEEIAHLKADLLVAPTVDNVELHPAAIENYKKDMDELSARLAEFQKEPHSALVSSLRKVVAEVTVHPSPSNMTPIIEVKGWLASLIGEDVENGYRPKWANKVVAEEGFEPPTQGL
ncbi:Resolvase domain protein [Brucella anthropi ATCC 49188]|uniref:Resolvase domain protein n=1 Tax=Brucella anthropi (strain ATCC 49188 / DSM 6882 / CCUG 24695 / JCM 21032 / LMG 3331 / NBRC 15819 / NCTC 12168 / Alc 37) TaxID=439375 RepID=A6WZ75_BRUA4|nr:Resolvase domain protein [Brucella anthropi ATCC 49188]